MHEIILQPYAPILVESTRSIGYTFEAALSDIIDNSIGKNATDINLLNKKPPFDIYAYLGQGAIADHFRTLLGLNGDTPTPEALSILAGSVADVDLSVASDSTLEDLIGESRNGNKDSEQLLQTSYEALLRAVAGQYVGVLNLVTDMVRQGTYGLRKAIEKYEAGTEAPFPAFAAWHIHKAICQAYDLAQEQQQCELIRRQEERLHLEDEYPSDEDLQMLAESGECRAAEFGDLLSGAEEDSPAFLYLQKIRDCSPLPEDELAGFLKKARLGDEDARLKAAEANLFLAAGIARRYFTVTSYTGIIQRPLQLDYIDYIQEANRGMVKALDTYDLNGDTPLIPFIVWHMHRQICLEYDSRNREMGRPRREMDLLVRVLMKYFELREDHEPSYEELHEVAGEAMDQLVPYLKKLRDECCS